jgi:glucose/arabinose dehydrogenase
VQHRVPIGRPAFVHFISIVSIVGILALIACSGPDRSPALPDDRATVTTRPGDPTRPVDPTQPGVAETRDVGDPTITVEPGSTVVIQTPTGPVTTPPIVTPPPDRTPGTTRPTATTVEAPPVDLGSVSIGLELAGSGFDQPVQVVPAGDGSGRAFVLEKTGGIRLLDGSPYLDIRDRVLFYDLLTVQHELGLVGLAFHPHFASNRYFYVHYTDRNQDHVISRFTEGPDGRADRNSEKILLTFPQPEVNFVGGTLEFGRDGYLYIATGTGTADDPSQVVAQQLDNLWGKILRIDVDNGDPYGIPADNPFVGEPNARGEIWAYGLRNPWRFSWDALTNDLYIGGPGEFAWEWINFVPGGDAGGLNFGWPILEGPECWEFSTLPCDPTGLEQPILWYEHGTNQNCVVIGGLVVRSSPTAPGAEGVYLYGDYCSGRIWGAARDDAGNWVSRELLDTNMLITSFGIDERNDVYVCDGLTGNVYRITSQ